MRLPRSPVLALLTLAFAACGTSGSDGETGDTSASPPPTCTVTNEGTLSATESASYVGYPSLSELADGGYSVAGWSHTQPEDHGGIAVISAWDVDADLTLLGSGETGRVSSDDLDAVQQWGSTTALSGGWWAFGPYDDEDEGLVELSYLVERSAPGALQTAESPLDLASALAATSSGYELMGFLGTSGGVTTSDGSVFVAFMGWNDGTDEYRAFGAKVDPVTGDVTAGPYALGSTGMLVSQHEGRVATNASSAFIVACGDGCEVDAVSLDGTALWSRDLPTWSYSAVPVLVADDSRVLVVYGEPVDGDGNASSDYHADYMAVHFAVWDAETGEEVADYLPSRTCDDMGGEDYDCPFSTGQNWWTVARRGDDVAILTLGNGIWTSSDWTTFTHFDEPSISNVGNALIASDGTIVTALVDKWSSASIPDASFEATEVRLKAYLCE